MWKRCVPLVSLAVCGCVGLPAGGARTLDRGRWQVQAGERALVQRQTGLRDDGTTRYTWYGGVTGMYLGVAYGATDRLEVDAGALMTSNAALGTLGAKIALLRAPAPDSGLDLSVAPSIGGWAQFAWSDRGGGSSSAGAAFTMQQLPVLLGLNLPGGHQAIAGVTLANVYMVANDVDADTMYAGGHLGFSWRIAGGFRFLPQVAVGRAWRVKGPRSTEGGGPLDIRGTITQVGLDVLLGGD